MSADRNGVVSAPAEMTTRRGGLHFTWEGGPYIEVAPELDPAHPFDVVNTTDENGEPPPFNRAMFYYALENVDMKALRHHLRASQMDGAHWTDGLAKIQAAVASLSDVTPYTSAADVVLKRIIELARALQS